MAHLQIDDPGPSDLMIHPGARPAARLTLRDGTMIIAVYLEDLDTLDELIETLHEARDALVAAHLKVRGEIVAADQLEVGDEVVLAKQRCTVSRIVLDGDTVTIGLSGGHSVQYARREVLQRLAPPAPAPLGPPIAEVIDAFGARS